MNIHIGHSPDPDDAFMWYPLVHSPRHGRPGGGSGDGVASGDGPGDDAYSPLIDTGPYRFIHVLEDIQSLNDRSERADLEVTALSIHQFPHVADRYALTSCGASMGDGYGPMVVAPRDRRVEVADLTQIRIAVPGERTSAFLALSLLLGRRVPDYEVVPFDQIIAKVVAGDYDAGLIIHEGQLTYADAGLDCVVDLGRWWSQERGLPLPLGGNAIRRDLGSHMRPLCRILLNSIQYALDHREQAVAYALQFARDMGVSLADRFVGMYVNQWTLDYGDRGREAVRRFLTEAADAGLVPHCGELEIVEP